MRRLSSLGSRQLASRKGRSALTALGIVLGVAVLVGVLVANATTQVGVDRLVVDLVGRADVVINRVGAFESTADREDFDQLLSLANVDAVSLSLVRQSALERPGTTDLSIQLRGIEPRTMQEVQPIKLTEGKLFDEIHAQAALSADLANDLSVDLNDRIRLATPTGFATLRIVGILEATGIARSDTGEIVFTSLARAQKMFGVPNQISNARVVLAPETDVTSWIEEHEQNLGTGFQMRDASTIAQGFQQFLALIGGVFTVFSGISLFIGAFLIYLTLTTAIVERTRVYGTLRALGASGKQIRMTVLLEAAVLGLVSSVGGVGVGLLIASGLLSLMENLFEVDFGAVVVAPTAIVAGLIVGVITTLVASFVPARRAARLEPVVAMQGGIAEAKGSRRTPLIGATLTAFGFAGALAGVAVATPLLLVGSVLITPAVLPRLARVAGALTERISKGLGPAAVLHMVKERSRSGYTLGLVMTVMGTIFAIAGLSGSLLKTVDSTLDAQLGADLLISPSGSADEAFESELNAIPEIAAVSGTRFAPVRFLSNEEEQQGFARIIDPKTAFEVSGFVLTEGSLSAVQGGLARGGVVLLPGALATENGFEVGDVISIKTLEGPIGFELVATYASLLPAPEIVMALSDGQRYLGARSVDGLQVKVAPEVSIEEARAAIDARLSDDFSYDISTITETKDQIRSDFNTFFSIFYAIVLIAAIVGLLGMANTLAVSVLQRTREIGVLRAIGAGRGQIRLMILVESLTMSVVAFLLSVPLGIALGMATLAGFRSTFGIEAEYVYPLTALPVVAVFGIVLAIAASIAPARRASRLDVVTALTYE